jgi:Holliday junction resolvase RusA-like endonuclease
MIQIVIDRKTPSVNHLYGHNKFGNFYLKKEGKDLRKYISENINIPKEELKDFLNVKLSVIIEVYENWYTKKGDVKKKDVANREKFLIDSVFNALGLDDCFVFEHTMIKVQSDEERAILSIRKL